MRPQSETNAGGTCFITNLYHFSCLCAFIINETQHIHSYLYECMLQLQCSTQSNLYTKSFSLKPSTSFHLEVGVFGNNVSSSLYLFALPLPFSSPYPVCPQLSLHRHFYGLITSLTLTDLQRAKQTYCDITPSCCHTLSHWTCQSNWVLTYNQHYQIVLLNFSTQRKRW